MSTELKQELIKVESKKECGKAKNCRPTIKYGDVIVSEAGSHLKDLSDDKITLLNSMALLSGEVRYAIVGMAGSAKNIYLDGVQCQKHNGTGADSWHGIAEANKVQIVNGKIEITTK